MCKTYPSSIYHFAVCVIFLTPCSASLTYANDAESQLEEIIVTARQRDEGLQKVPLSVSAYSSQQIEDARIDQVGNFIGLTPNVTLVEEADFGQSFMTIRGITQVRNAEAPVAVVVDGVLQVNPAQFSQELYDLESIEVVRGPQGALYGRNATGGAIIINTKQPSNEFGGHARVGVGKSNEWLVQSSLSGAIVEDELFFRAGVRYRERDGYLNNITLGKKVDPLKDASLRSTLRWEVSESLSADLHVNISRLETGANNFAFQGTIYADDGISFAGFDWAKFDANDTSTPYTANNIGHTDRDIEEIALKLEYEMPFATLTSISAWSSLESHATNEGFPYTASLTNVDWFTDTSTSQYLDVGAWSQEIRLTSSDDKRLRWMGGFYYLGTDRFISTNVGIDQGLGIRAVERDPSVAESINPSLVFNADDNDNEAWALFGMVNYDLTDKVEFSTALRYDRDLRKQTVSPLATTGNAGIVNKRNYSKLQPQLTVRYSPMENFNLYVSWGEGFRSGQFNQNGVGAAADAAGVPGLSDVVNQEETETIEVGVKSDWFDNRLRVNGALFSTEVTDQIYFVFVGAIPADVLANIDRVDLLGGELEVTARLADGLDAYVSWGYVDSEIKQFTLRPSAAGNWSPYTPRSTFNVGSQFRRPITEKIGLFARFDFEKRGKQYWDTENSSARRALDLLTLRLGIESTQDTWSLVATINNALDEEFNVEWVDGGFAHRGNPRTWGVDFTYKF